MNCCETVWYTLQIIRQTDTIWIKHRRYIETLFHRVAIPKYTDDFPYFKSY